MVACPHPHATCDPSRVHHYEDAGFQWADSLNATDVSYHAARAYQAIYSALKKAHRGLLREICNDGGRMVDFGSATVGDYFSIVDSYDPLSNRQAFYDASHPDGRGWDDTEYFDQDRGKGVLHAFHGSGSGETSHRFALKGLQPERSYRLHFHDGSTPDVVLPGSSLMHAGIPVELPLPESSELVLLERR